MFRLPSCRARGVVFLALCVPLSALARTPGAYDDRWYGTLGAGANHQDSTRDTENAATGTIGVGKFFNPRWSLDATVDYQKPVANANEDLNFSQYGVTLDARRHFRKDGRTLNPYLVGGLGYQRTHEEFDAFPSPDSPGVDRRGYATAKLGVGVQADYRRVSWRGEVAARHGFDGDSRVAPGASGFTDTLASLTLVVPFGGVALAQVQTTPAPDPCQQRECPPTPDAIAIDLSTVHFEFDRDTLTADAQQRLDESVRQLMQHPDLAVAISGHTDSVGTLAYNQALSERRAQAVADYLIAHGVSSHRIVGVSGYGETRPVAPNTHDDGSDNPEGRAANRRAELDLGQP